MPFTGYEELPAIPKGARYLAARREIAGVRLGEMTRGALDTIAHADKLLQTARCVGRLPVCAACVVQAAPCPVALEVRANLDRQIGGLPDGHPEKVIYEQTVGTTPGEASP